MVLGSIKNYENELPFSILAIGTPSENTGGDRRTMMMLLEAPKFKVNVQLHLPFGWLVWNILKSKEEPLRIQTLLQNLHDLEYSGIKIPDATYKLLKNPSLYLEKETLDLNEIHFSYFSWLLDNMLKSYDKQRRAYLSDVLNSVSKPNIIYSYNEDAFSISDANFFSKNLGVDQIILLQSKPYGNFIPELFVRSILTGYYDIVKETILGVFPALMIRKELKNSIKGRTLKAIFSVSDSCFDFPGAHRLRKKYNLEFQTLSPAVSSENRCSPNDPSEKEGLFFYARLTPEKGILDLIYIVQQLDENVKVRVAGKFKNKKLQKIFIEKTKGRNVEYLGYLPRDMLLNEIKKSKALVYPSHFDAYSTVIFEALQEKTCVIAYDIHASRASCSHLKPVFLIQEFDYKAMARKCMEIVRMSTSEYGELFNGKNITELLELSHSWYQVAEHEIEILKNFAKRRKY